MSGFHWPSFLKPKPSHTEVRYIAATREESKRSRQLRADRRMELEIMALHVTAEQRQAAKERASVRSPMKREGRG